MSSYSFQFFEMFKFEMLKIQNLAYMEPELQKVALVVQHIYYLDKRVKFG
jgi:hypothetical protein